MRDTHDRMPEILAAFERDGHYFATVRVSYAVFFRRALLISCQGFTTATSSSAPLGYAEQTAPPRASESSKATIRSRSLAVAFIGRATTLVR
jgi:hypothetical protein